MSTSDTKPTWIQQTKRFYNGMLSSNKATLKQTLHFFISSLGGLGLKHLGLRIINAPLGDCEAVTLMLKLSGRGSLFVTRISLLT